MICLEATYKLIIEVITMELVIQIIETVGILIAAFVAIYGINTWRTEFRGKKEHELAEEVLTLTYNCRDLIKIIRNPFSTVGEGCSRQSNEGETPEDKTLLDRAYVVYERYNKHQESFNKLFSLRYRFMVLFGADAKKPIDDFQKVFLKLFTAAQLLPIYWRETSDTSKSTKERESNLKRMYEQEEIFWIMGDEENDEFGKSVNDIVSQIEEICRAIIE